MMSTQKGGLDEVVQRFDRLLRAACGVGNRAARPVPAAAPGDGRGDTAGATPSASVAGAGADAGLGDADATMTPSERRHAAGLMRVNHAGEVCAQALYIGQSFAARTPDTRALLDRSADEEFDHLVWCRTRLEELGHGPSRLDPIWFMGALTMGTLAGVLGDRVSLGFLQETERQVEAHIDDHLEKLPPQDTRSRAILETMKAEEMHHAETARKAGAMRFPPPVKKAMAGISKVMTRTAYFV